MHHPSHLTPARIAAILLALLPSVATLCRADMATTWNDIALQAVRADQLNPAKTSYLLAKTQVAVFEAVNAIENHYTGYLAAGSVQTPVAGASSSAAAAKAAHDVLVQAFPHYASFFDDRLSATTADIPTAQANAGFSVGTSAASAILATRVNDGSTATSTYTPQPSGTVGAWQPTPIGNNWGGSLAAPILPQWGGVRPFALDSSRQFTVAPPPSVSSPEYAAALNEVHDLGARFGSTRTADQTAIAVFWADGPGTASPPGHWNIIATDLATREGLTLSESSRMLALLNLAGADAGIAVWDLKYTSDFWRPLSGIIAADTDGNNATAADPDWLPYIDNPQFPSYASGHSTFSAASAAVLASVFGTDDIAFDVRSESEFGVVRSFTSFSEAASEAGESRVYGGIHWRFDVTAGLQLGGDIGSYVAESFLVAIPEPSNVAFIGGLVAGLCALARRRAGKRG